MPHANFKLTAVAAAAGMLFATCNAYAQVKQPAPTGQVPKAYTGVQSAPPATFKPQPTGQIAPEAPGHLGTIVQPAPAAAPVQKVSEVQDLGFEVNSRPATQQGMVPKVNTSQDPRTMPERYQPQVIQQPSSAATGQVQVQQVPVTGAAAARTPAAGPPAAGPPAAGSPAAGSPGGTYSPAQTSPVQNQAPATTGRPTSQPGQVGAQPAAPRPSQRSTPKAATQRVDPN